MDTAGQAPPWEQRRIMMGAQVGLVFLLLVDTLATTTYTGEVRSVGALLAMHALTLLALVGLVASGPRTPTWVIAALPLLDLAALGLARIATPGTGSDVLCFVPALWLASLLSYRGVVVATVGTAALMSLPWLVVLGPVRGNLSSAILSPLVVGLIGTVVSWIIAHLKESRRESEAERATRRAAVQEASLQRRFNAAILDTVDIGLLLLDADGRYLSMNERHRDFMQLAFPQGHDGMAGQRGHVLAMDGQTVLEPDQMPTARAVAGEEFDDALIWVGAEPSARRALSVSARIVRDEDGRHGGVAMAYKDVTDFMQALAVKDDFVAMVSHELRTPLTSIRGYTSVLLEDADLAPVIRNHLSRVDRNAARLERLVGDLLHAAQAARGTLQVVRRPVDLTAVVSESVRAASGRAAEAGVTLETVLVDQLTLMADAERLGQLVDNLVSNAVKYSPGGGVVKVALAARQGQAELTVSDEGIGIAPGDRERLFTRFFRAREASEREIQGIGLGLSISRQIVEGHGGRIDVDSVPGEGSTFRVRLPLETSVSV